jgi:hypothetical protein
MEATIAGDSTGDADLRTCVSNRLAASPPRRLPTSPFAVQLGFCPRDDAACFVGPVPSPPSRTNDPAVVTLLDAASPEIVECVARMRPRQTGSVALFVRTRGGAVQSMGTSSVQVGLEEATRRDVFECLAEGLRGRCIADSEGFDVVVMVQRPR